MPNDSITIVFKGYDEVGSVIKSIASSSKGLSKEYETLEKRAKTLSDSNRTFQKEIGTLSKELVKAKSTMKETEKQFKRTGDEADGIKFEKAIQEYERLSAAIKEAKGSSAIIQKSMKSNADEMGKLFDESGRVGGSESGEFLSSIFGSDMGGKLAKSGILKMIGDTAANGIGAIAESALGQPFASLGSSITSGIASGAVAGAMAGIPGIGAVVGGITGTISGLIQIGQQYDDAFKSYYANLHDTVKANTTESLSRGKTLAAAKETEEAAALAEQMRQRGAPEEEITAVLTGTYQAAWDRLEESKSITDTAYGTGYNEKRKAGIEAEQAAYDGELGAALGELNEITGSNQAYLDNLAEQYNREALSAVLLGEETTIYDQKIAEALKEMGAQYAALSEVHDSGDSTEEEKAEAGLKMQSLKEQAEAMAKAAYESSEQYQLVVETEQEQIAAIRENTKALDGWRNSMALGEEKTKGLAENFTIVENLTPEEAAENEEHMQKLKDLDLLAVGLKYVPYDNFPAMLHQGERVLTAEEARQADRGGGSVQVTVTGNEFHVRSDSDIDDIARALARELNKAGLRAG